MARVTRSKKIEIAEDSTALSFHPQSTDDQLQQPTALNEINNAMPLTSEDAVLAAEVKGLKAAYRTAIGTGKRGKNGNGKKKGKQDYMVEEEEIFNDADNVNGTNNEPVATVNQESEAFNIEENRPRPAVRVTRRQAAKQAAEEAVSKSVGESMHESASTASDESSDLSEKENDTKVQPALAKTPLKTLEEIESLEGSVGSSSLAAAIDGDDSFVQEIITRSPAKPVSRIEDSVEALDQLEEALEALDEAALAEKMVSPEKARKSVSQQTNAPEVDKPISKRPASSMATKPGHASMRVKPTAPRQTVVKKATSMVFKPTSDKAEEKADPIVKATTRRPISLIVKQEPAKLVVAKRPTSLIVPKGAVKSMKPPTKPDFELPGEAIARKLKEKREARMAQRQSSEDSFRTAVIPASKVKSTKPPTKPSFELPGEALSRKKKEEHEARVKAREEEEEKKRREFKAKPVRSSVPSTYVPRETVASRARQSKVGMEAEEGNLAVSKRGSVIAPHRPSITQLNMANTSAPRAPGPATSRKPSPAIASKTASTLPPHLQRTVSASEVHIQRQRGKEIYNRDAKLTEEIERERREREAAAKRAREEAAERGRQASREWAEKQMAKKMAGGDAGMGAGFGPGGQLGLKA